MEEVDPETALSAAESERERRRDRAVDALEWFRGREGLVARSEAVTALADAHGWSEAQSNRAVGDVVGDLVDPVQQVVHPERGKLVGVIKYHEHPDAGCYAYVDYDDVTGRRRRAVCSRCVVEADSDAEVAHATGGEGTVSPDATWTQLYSTIEDHYDAEHDVEPSEVEVGASLASGTTISGNTAFHAGNDGVGSGLDADSLEGQEPFDLNRSDSEIENVIDGSNVSVGNADRVDGQDANELGASGPTSNPNRTGGSFDPGKKGRYQEFIGVFVTRIEGQSSGAIDYTTTDSSGLLNEGEVATFDPPEFLISMNSREGEVDVLRPEHTHDL